MASMWRRAMHYLGLGPDDDYDDYDDEYEAPEPRPLATRPPSRYPAAGAPRPFGEPRSSVRTLSPSLGDDTHPNGSLNGNGTGGGHDVPDRTATAAGATSRAARAERDRERDRGERHHDRGDDQGAERPPPARPRSSTVRTLPPASSRPHVVTPASFNDAQEIGDEFKSHVPVILNLQGVSRDLARRLIDFASGLCYALDGQMERVANQVYLLTPTDMEVSAEERRRLHERGYEA
jgi:cell division inhibitor SepF